MNELIPSPLLQLKANILSLRYGLFVYLYISFKFPLYNIFQTATLTDSFLVIEHSWINEKTLGDINIIDATAIAVVRKNKPHPNPGVGFLVLPGDLFILFGSHMQLNKSFQYHGEGPSSQI